jgi:hypothetical protein
MDIHKNARTTPHSRAAIVTRITRLGESIKGSRLGGRPKRMRQDLQYALSARGCGSACRVEVVTIREALETEPPEAGTSIFLGAELMTDEGVIIHPRGRQQLVESVRSKWRMGTPVEPQTYVFGESWKIVRASPAFYYSPHFSVLRPGAYGVLVTECAVYEANGDARLTPRAGGETLTASRHAWARKLDECMREEHATWGSVFERLATEAD